MIKDFMPTTFQKLPKRCPSKTRGIGEQLYIVQLILKGSNTRRKNVAIVWIDNYKAYAIVTKMCIIDFLQMDKISEKVIKCHTEIMKNWKVELITGGKTLAEVKILKSIFQRDSFFTTPISNNNDSTQIHT